MMDTYEPERDTPDNTPLVSELSETLYRTRGWIKLTATLMIISGVLGIFTLFGAILSFLPLWMGALLFKTNNRIEAAYLNGDRAMHREAMDAIRKVFVIGGVSSVIIVVTSLGFLYLTLMSGGYGLLNILG